MTHRPRSEASETELGNARHDSDDDADRSRAGGAESDGSDVAYRCYHVLHRCHRAQESLQQPQADPVLPAVCSGRFQQPVQQQGR
ncbi:hypothetical protein D3C76_1569640 [compost metagenome]